MLTAQQSLNSFAMTQKCVKGLTMRFASWLVKAIGWLLAHALEGTITVAMSFVALASFYIFDSLTMKLAGFFGSMIVGYLAAYYLGKLRGEHRDQT